MKSLLLGLITLISVGFNTDTINTLNVTGFSEIKKQNTIQVEKDEAYITLFDVYKSPVYIKIISTDGKVVFDICIFGGDYFYIINLDFLPRGNYTLYIYKK